MSRERTFFVDLASVSAQGRRGVLLARMMMAANDLLLANRSMRPHLANAKRTGHLARCFFRLQCGHISEALPIIAKLNRDVRLRSVVDKCSQKTQQAFTELAEYAYGARRDEFRQRVRVVRNKVGFHYDQAKVKSAIARRAGQPRLSRSRITLASSIDKVRFHVADDVEGTLVVRLLWRVPDGLTEGDFRDRTNELLLQVSGICRTFVAFCGEFVPRALSDLGCLSA